MSRLNRYSIIQSCESWIYTSANKLRILYFFPTLSLIFFKIGQVGWWVCVMFSFKGISFSALAGTLKDIHILVLKPFQRSFGCILQSLSSQSNILEITCEESPLCFSIAWSFYFLLQVNRAKNTAHPSGMMLPLPHFMACKACCMAVDTCPDLVWQRALHYSKSSGYF